MQIIRISMLSYGDISSSEGKVLIVNSSLSQFNLINISFFCSANISLFERKDGSNIALFISNHPADLSVGLSNNILRSNVRKVSLISCLDQMRSRLTYLEYFFSSLPRNLHFLRVKFLEYSLSMSEIVPWLTQYIREQRRDRACWIRTFLQKVIFY